MSISNLVTRDPELYLKLVHPKIYFYAQTICVLISTLFKILSKINFILTVTCLKCRIAFFPKCDLLMKSTIILVTQHTHLQHFLKKRFLLTTGRFYLNLVMTQKIRFRSCFFILDTKTTKCPSKGAPPSLFLNYSQLYCQQSRNDFKSDKTYPTGGGF